MGQNGTVGQGCGGGWVHPLQKGREEIVKIRPVEYYVLKRKGQQGFADYDLRLSGGLVPEDEAVLFKGSWLLDHRESWQGFFEPIPQGSMFDLLAQTA